ncbi:MAG: glycoside hydrolase family 130 protein [Planctomycetota bacterium]
MNETFWHLFGDDSQANCCRWTRSPKNPVIPAQGDTWKKVWTANPDVLRVGGKTLLYYRGHGTMPGSDGEGHDRIGSAEIISVTRDVIEIHELNDGDPIIDIGPAGALDDQHVLDPAAVEHGGCVLLYCSAVGSGPDSVGMSISYDDGLTFRKFGQMFTGRAPEIVIKDDLVYMLYQKYLDDHYEVFLAKSADGVKFEEIQDAPVLAPGPAGSWHSFDVCTPRVEESDGAYYMVYAGSATKCDVPDGFGLARSTDLVNWEQHPGNPIFALGGDNDADGGGIWFPALIETDDFFAMLYEGTRCGAVTSQICQASIDK